MKITDILNKIVNFEFKTMNAKSNDGEPVFKSVTLNKTSELEPNLVIFYGDNASGKSLFSKILMQQMRKANWNVRATSMENRTQAGVERAFIYGSDSDQSTGATSIKAAEKCMKALKHDNENEKGLSILDEPDLGLSPRYSKAMGEFIGQNINELRDNQCIVLVTHSKEIIESTLSHTNKNYWTVGINTDKNVNDWLNNQETASIEELLNLEKKGFKQRSAIDRAMKSA